MPSDLLPDADLLDTITQATNRQTALEALAAAAIALATDRIGPFEFQCIVDRHRGNVGPLNIDRLGSWLRDGEELDHVYYANQEAWERKAAHQARVDAVGALRSAA